MSSVKLSPVLKQLLAQRHPQSFASPPKHILYSVLEHTRAEAKQHGALNGWLVLSTCTLLTANTPGAVGDLYRFASSSSKNGTSQTRLELAAAIDVAAKMREAALKSSIFVGVPRTILAMAAMTEAFEDDVKNGLRKDSHRTVTPANVDNFVNRGNALWKSIYEPHAEKLYNKLGSYHPDFITFIIQAYGIVLAPFAYPPNASDPTIPTNTSDPTNSTNSAIVEKEKEQGDLTRTLGSVVGTACLRAETHVGPQLTSHVFGLLKAQSSSLLSAEDRWLSSDEGTEWVVRSVDRIYDVARGYEGEKAKL